MDETWLCHYDPDTKQQSMEWRHNDWKSSRLDFLGSRRHPLHWLPSKGWSITHLCWSNWGTFWRKNAAGKSPRGSCSSTTMPRLTGHLQPRRNWPNWASNFLITHPILRIWPCRTTTCSLTWKKQLKVHHFSSDAVISAAENWWDGSSNVWRSSPSWNLRAPNAFLSSTPPTPFEPKV